MSAESSVIFVEHGFGAATMTGAAEDMMLFADFL